MTVSVFELFSVGIGPSSSHTVGPMRAAVRFVGDLRTMGALADVSDVHVDLFGSLAATGAGHGTMPAVLLGLEGFEPETIETDDMERRLEEMRASRQIRLGGETEIKLAEDEIVLHPETILPFHPNGNDDHRIIEGQRRGASADVLLDRRRLRGHRVRGGPAGSCTADTAVVRIREGTSRTRRPRMVRRSPT